MKGAFLLREKKQSSLHEKKGALLLPPEEGSVEKLCEKKGALPLPPVSESFSRRWLSHARHARQSSIRLLVSRSAFAIFPFFLLRSEDALRGCSRGLFVEQRDDRRDPPTLVSGDIFGRQGAHHAFLRFAMAASAASSELLLVGFLVV